jgi:hypothetical protein
VPLGERWQETIAARLEGASQRVVHTVQVTSFGGVGTTTMCDHLACLGVDVPTTPGHFPFKHGRIPPRAYDVPDGFRVVYILGDPRDAVLSIFRRGRQESHYRGMIGFEPSATTLHHLSNLDTFLEGGVDEFLIEDHLDRWMNRAPIGYPVLFLKFWSLPESWSTVMDFVGAPQESEGPELVPRASDWSSLAEPQRTRLDRMYGALAERIDAMPAVHIG